jgi:hypothetical protein
MEELVLIVQDLAVEVLFDESQNSLEQGVERGLVGSDRGNRNLSTLEKFLITDFGGRNLKLVADPALQALDDHSLFFEPATSRKMKIEDPVSDHHTSRETGNGKRKTTERAIGSLSFPV